MTAVLLTIDTELSLMAQNLGIDGHTNMLSAIYGRTPKGNFGIGYKINRLNSHRLKAIFFVEALHTRVLGDEYLRRMLDTILSHNHEVQLHLHVEWLQWADISERTPRYIRGMANLDIASQVRLLRLGADAIERCGAPRPTAFRAGGFEANDATLAAAAIAGLRYESSYNQAFVGSDCRMTQRRHDFNRPFTEDSVIEVPITCFEDYPGHIRPVQVCAISAQELKHVLRVADRRGDPIVNIVSHSFELLNRARTAPNPLLLRRFDAFCDLLQERSGTLSFADLRPESLLAPPRVSTRLPSLTTGTLVRTAARMLEQGAGRLIFDRHPYSMPVMPPAP